MVTGSIYLMRRLGPWICSEVIHSELLCAKAGFAQDEFALKVTNQNQPCLELDWLRNELLRNNLLRKELLRKVLLRKCLFINDLLRILTVDLWNYYCGIKSKRSTF
jgi:hypothetical protein